MRRLFGEFCEGNENTIRFSQEDRKHLSVVRAADGDHITAVVGGEAFVCRLFLRDGEFFAEVCGRSDIKADPQTKITVFLCLIKGERFEWAIQKCVELGAFAIVPVASKNCVVKLSGTDAEKKRLRWQKIAEEAAKQSGRDIVPVVYDVTGFSAAVSSAANYDTALFCYEKADIPLRTVLEKSGGIATAMLLTGPEGGFDAEEAELAKKCGMSPVSLGARILRAETAPVAALSCVYFHTGDI